MSFDTTLHHAVLTQIKNGRKRYRSNSPNSWRKLGIYNNSRAIFRCSKCSDYEHSPRNSKNCIMLTSSTLEYELANDNQVYVTAELPDAYFLFRIIFHKYNWMGSNAAISVNPSHTRWFYNVYSSVRNPGTGFNDSNMYIANYNTQLSVGLLCPGLRGGDLTGEVTKKMSPPSRLYPGMYRGCYEFKNNIIGQVPAMPGYGGGGGVDADSCINVIIIKHLTDYFWKTMLKVDSRWFFLSYFVLNWFLYFLGPLPLMKYKKMLSVTTIPVW